MHVDMDPATPHIWDLPHQRPDPVTRAQGAPDQRQEASPPQASRSGGTGSSPQPGKHQVRDGDIGLTVNLLGWFQKHNRPRTVLQSISTSG